MLQIKNVNKTYRTGELVQKALDEVSLDLRDNEFVAVLGPSGSGKTTLLNVIGGLDRYDSGEMLVDGVSTKNYKDRDWDTYRNHTIGFVFQNYNLISHQSVLANVELALTIGGISRRERKKRAQEALEQVGLAEHMHKKPNQLSGGQMQRVAIARALVNDPKVLLADEPTGALDSATSVQVMELLKEVARDRLVVMVTHNPELADTYATRIVRLKDGRIEGDSDPYNGGDRTLAVTKEGKKRQASMSMLTSLSLSFSNLRTKMGRTLLTAFAGSIGIIGIALILSLSTGADQYIQDIQRDTMTSYPITVEAVTIDISGFVDMAESRRNRSKEPEHPMDQIYSDNTWLEMRSNVSTSLTENNLTSFKKYLDDPESPIRKYLGSNGVVYQYNTAFNVYTYDSAGQFINTADLSQSDRNPFFSGSFGNSDSNKTSHRGFSEMLPDSVSGLANENLLKNYTLLYGRWPEKMDEVVLIANSSNEISLRTLYSLGFLPAEEYRSINDRLEKGEKMEMGQLHFDYESLAGKSFYLLPACDLYEKKADGSFAFIGEDMVKTEKAARQAIELHISGVVRSTDDSVAALLNGPVGYTKLLTDHLIRHTEESAVVQAQKADPGINVLNGLRFSAGGEAEKAEDVRQYLRSRSLSEKAAFYSAFLRSSGMSPEMIAGMGEAELAAGLDMALDTTMTDEMLAGLYSTLIANGSYEDNMEAFGLVSPDAPSAINLYCDSFEDKEHLSDEIEAYNETVEEEDKITYTDYVGLLMNSVTSIIDVISIVLIAFVAVSLVVSSIMIGIITYISVLERTREIGVLRALGASKRNISEVFNAETLIIGFTSGLMGIGIAELLLIPGNRIIHNLAGNTDVSAFIRPHHALLLIVLSTVLTLIGGFIPSKKAARRDPVAALRSE